MPMHCQNCLRLQVFFTDSLKFFLSLYGHKLPVLSLDISSDSTLLVSGSADKNIKVRGGAMCSTPLRSSLAMRWRPQLAGVRPTTMCAPQVWGLDFGDCHRSLFAHADAVMGVSFVPKTHYVFTVGKDKMVKYWDIDRQVAWRGVAGWLAGLMWAAQLAARGCSTRRAAWAPLPPSSPPWCVRAGLSSCWSWPATMGRCGAAPCLALATL